MNYFPIFIYFKKNSKNFLILLTEITAIFFMVFGIIPREAALFLTGIMAFYFIFSPLEDSLWVFVASIPLFIALPLSDNFETMANWRILLLILFIVWLIRFFPKDKLLNPIKFFKSSKKTPLDYLIIIFLSISCLSLLIAGNIWLGIKQILFLLNAFILFIIIRDLAARDKKIINKIFEAAKIAIGIVLAVGLIQYVAIFFVRLYPFWQFWARNFIPVFYGQDLSNLLSYSNTWFSYYSSLPATLRMFSVFPDSHSFALFCVFSLPLVLTLIFIASKRKKIFFYYFLLIIFLLAIIFSGSRGVWAAALGIFIFLLFAALFLWRKKILYSKQHLELIIGCLILFFLLFPLSSRLLLLQQQIQIDRPIILDDFSLFERAKSIFDLDEISVRSRLEIWQKTLDSIIRYPLLGVGIGNYTAVLNEPDSLAKKGSSAHSLYLNIAAETGIFALLIIMAAFFQIIRDNWRVFSKDKKSFFQIWSGFFILALLWALCYSLFDVVLLNDKVILFFLALLGILYAKKISLSID